MAYLPTFKRIILATEGPDLDAGARQYCSQLLPDVEVHLYSPEEFESTFYGEHDPEELRILMLHADESGRLQPGSPIIQGILSSKAPVLVTRHSRGGTVPDATIRRIVIPLDGSSAAGQAVSMSSGIARSLDVPVLFVMVIDPARVIPPAYAYDPEAWGMIEELRQTSHWALSQAEETLRRDGITVSSELVLGPITSSLAATIGNGDLVVMTTHGPDRHRLRNRESIARKTLETVPQPMLIMQAKRQDPVVVDAYQASSLADHLQRGSARKE